MPDKPPVTISTSHEQSADDQPYHHAPAIDEPGSNNAASNGYWIHDDTGPKHYVAPPDANGLTVDEGELVARLDATLQSSLDLDASRMHVALENSAVVLSGIAVSKMESQLIGRAVQTVAGDVRVINRLVIDEALQKNRVLP